jgi:cellobiose phosphorylase
MQIVSPPYTEVEEGIGLISRCVPGKKENGAVFNHASAWFVLASLISGKTDDSYDIYTRMMPLNSSKDIDRYEVEPYVYAEYVTSPVHPTQNQASHSWLTGSAVWMYRIGLDHFIGFKTSIKGISIEPNIPSAWKNLKAVRYFRGIKINLKVDNPNGVNSTINKITFDGEKREKAFIDPNTVERNEISVHIIMG